MRLGLRAASARAASPRARRLIQPLSMADFRRMTSWERVSAGSAGGTEEGRGERRGEAGKRSLRRLPAAGRPSASRRGALRPLLTKDGRMPAPWEAGSAQPGCRLSGFSLRR